MKVRYLIISFIIVLFAAALPSLVEASSVTNEQINIEKAHAYPNPFDNEKEVTKISFQIYTKKGIDNLTAIVVIHDFSGKKVWTKKENRTGLIPGYNPVKILWGGENDMGDKVANGLYYAKIIVEGPNTKIKVVKILVK